MRTLAPFADARASECSKKEEKKKKKKKKKQNYVMADLWYRIPLAVFFSVVFLSLCIYKYNSLYIYIALAKLLDLCKLSLIMFLQCTILHTKCVN